MYLVSKVTRTTKVQYCTLF